MKNSLEKRIFQSSLKEAKKEMYNFNSSYFIGLLPQSEMWRLYDFFREDAVFLDIEATGIYEKDDFFMIGLYDGINTKITLKNNFDYKKLKNELMKYKLIVSFNGSSFDAPFLNKRYPGLLPKIPHFDVKSIAGRIGLSGGLKEIEKLLVEYNEDDVINLKKVADFSTKKLKGDIHSIN